MLHVKAHLVGGEDLGDEIESLFLRGKEGKDYSFFYLDIPMEAAFWGKRIKVLLQGREVPCKTCNGLGYVWKGTRPVCRECMGKGYKDIPWGKENIRIVCKVCGATGYSNQARCSACQGKGHVHIQREVFISIPPGVRPGTLLELEPHESLGIGPTFLEIGIKFPKGWRLSGDDIVTTLKIDIWSALLGTTATVATLDGEVPIEIPAGTPHGTEFILEQRGWIGKDSKRGDHRVVLEIVMPSSDMPGAVRFLLEQIKELWPVSPKDQG